MKLILSSRTHHYVARAGICLIMVVLIAGMAGCGQPPARNLQIRTWYDLHAVRDNLSGNHRLMNDLDATTPGYGELAGPAANDGKGWQPIGYWNPQASRAKIFRGTFDGQGYQIRDLFINRPDEYAVGLFGVVDGSKQVGSGIVADVGVVNATVIGGSSVGTLVGYITRLVPHHPATVSNCYATGSVAGNLSVGGLVGLSLGTVSRCYSVASVTGHDRVGGLVGLSAGNMSDSYSSGNVTGYTNVGGLVGRNEGIVSSCYSSAWVTGEQSLGGLVAVNEGIVSDSFWDVETSGQTTSAGGTGKTTAEMKNIATFMAWDIIAVADPNERNHAYTWNIVDGETYPFLSWQSTS